MTITTNRNRWGALALAAAMLAMGGASGLPLPETPDNVSAGVPFTAIATAYHEDFELGDGGYVASGNAEWEHGTPVSPPEPLAGQGIQMWGTDLDGDYENSACGWLQSSPIDLTAYPAGASTGVSVARLAYRQWMHFENRYDAGLVQASADGVTWQTITPLGGYTGVPLTAARTCLGLPADGVAFLTPAAPAAQDWKLAEFDVSSYLGGTLHVRWAFGSDTSVVKRGWYVDDVLVQVGAGASATVPLPSQGTDASVPFTPLTTLYAEDFEATDGGWSASGSGAWSWGAPTAPPTTLVGSLNAWGARLNGNYLPNECAQLTSPAIAIPGAPASGAEAARLSFKMWRYLESGYDAAQVEASSDDGATWKRLTPVGGYERALTSSFAASTRACLGITTADAVWSGPSAQPRDDEWTDVAVDVTSLMGSNAMFRFTFASEADLERRGIFVDDVLLQLGAGASVDLADPMSPALVNPLWTVGGTNPSWEYGFSQETGGTLPTWSTNLDGQYNANECSWIVSQPIDTNAIPGVGRLEMTFNHVFETATTADGGAIQVSRDAGATWTTVSPVGGYGSTLSLDARDCIYAGNPASPGWSGTAALGPEAVKVSLNSFVGSTIQIRFIFGSSPTSHDPGWTIWSVALTRGAGSIPLGAELPRDPLDGKADAELLNAIAGAPDGEFRVIVTGEAHEGVADLRFSSREAYAGWFDAKAAPFMEALSTTVAASGGDVIGSWSMLPGAAVELDLDGLRAVAALPGVAHVELDGDNRIQLIEPIPDDSVSASNTQGRQQLQAEDIWALGYRGAGITVTVIDTGIWPDHEAFKNADGSSRIALFANCVDGTCDIAPAIDDHGHGTHVAGTAVGSSLYVDPTFGVFQETGVAPEARLTVAKFLNGGGGGSFAAAVDSLDWAFNDAVADLTSNSWGASGCSSSAHAVMQMVRTTTDAGMLNVFAAGNSGSGSGTIGSPACSESALSVGAIDVNKNIASFSSRGPCSDTETGGPSRICPDVVAKGVAVRSAIPRSGAGNADPTGYKSWQGTSMATPHIAGAVILAEQMKRALTGTGWDTAARAEEQVFKMTAEDLGAAGEDNTFGWGLPQLLNIYALLDSTDEANVVASFGVSSPVLRQGNSALLTFGVRNLGGAVASGDFLATLEDTNGDVTTLKSTSVALGLLDGESVSHTFTVTGSVPPGTYTFRGSFAFSWTNATSGEVVSEVIERSGAFDVKRVFVQTELAGLDARTTPGDLQSIAYSATNTGNEDASNVTIEFTVADDYVFVPGGGYDPNVPNSRYSNPAPNRVVEDKSFGRVTLVFEVGALPQGGSFSFTTEMLPTLPGTYNFLSVAKWQDGAGTRFGQGSVSSQVVGLP